MKVSRYDSPPGRRTSVSCLAGIALLAAGCGGDARSETTQRGLPIAFGLARVIGINALLSRGLLVESIYQATLRTGGALTGRIVDTGTLKTGLLGVQYSAEPSDRLVVELGGMTHEFVVEHAQGNPQASTSAAWLLAPHELRYVHRVADQGGAGLGEAEISERYDGRSFECGIRGWLVQSGARYDVDLRAKGLGSTQRDYHGQEAQSAYELEGTIEGGGISVDVHERHTSTLAAATNLRILPSMRGSASRFNATINSVLHSGGSDYQLRNVRVQSDVTARGGRGQAGLTGVDGEILRDGAEFGRCVLQAGNAFVQTASGTIPLDLPLPEPTGR